MSGSAPSGLAAASQLQWGSHLTQFFGAGRELRDVLVPYFKAGLENNERCFWVTGTEFTAEQARSALRAAVPDLDIRERGRQIEITNARDWYDPGAKLRPQDIVTDLLQRENAALDVGYDGLRTSGNCAWVAPEQWLDFQEYETLVHKSIRGRRMICMCNYCIDQLQDGRHMDVMAQHDMVIPSARRPTPTPATHPAPPSGQFAAVLEAIPVAIYMTDADGYLTYYNQAAARIWGQRPALGLQRWCGTWKIFLFDGTPVPHDQCPMALAMKSGQPIHGVEAEAERPDGSRIACAVYPTPIFDETGKLAGGINMMVDISHRRSEEAKQTVLAQEMHHRVNNTLMSVLAIMNATFRQSATLEHFKANFSARITALSKTHAMLTRSEHSSVSFLDLLGSELNMFADGDKARVQMSGADFTLSERVAVPVGMAIHELATNAAKYGALSLQGGRLSLDWKLSENVAHLDWREINVPIKQHKTRIGFGTKLLKKILPEQIGAEFAIEYLTDGVRASLSFPVR